MSRNLKECELTEEVNRYMVKSAISSYESEGIIAIDGGDIRKPYAEKMEHLYPIWDGSKKEKAQGVSVILHGCHRKINHKTDLM